jgi:hypothetical protein
MVICTDCLIKYWPCTSLIWISSNKNTMIKNSIANNVWHFKLWHLNRYLTLLLFADTWPTYSCSHRNSIYLRVGEKRNYFAQRCRTFIYAKYIMPQFIRPEAEVWQIVFFFCGWERGRKTGIKVTETFQIFSQI